MAKNNIVPQAVDNNNSLKLSKADKEAIKARNQEQKLAKKEKKANKAKKAKANAEPKRNRVKETFSELKKVTWPTFGKAMAQTGMVLGIVAIFAVLVFGVDALLSWLFSLING